MSTISPISNFANYSSPVGNASGNNAEGSKVTMNPGESNVKSPGRKSSPAECETCKNRKYQDGSDEMVSFKAATHISPNPPHLQSVPMSRNMFPTLIKKRLRIMGKSSPPMYPSTQRYAQNADGAMYPVELLQHRLNITTKIILTKRI